MQRSTFVLHLSAALAVAALVSSPTTLFGQSSANVSINISSGGARSGSIPDDFLGISLETSSVAASNNNGATWLSGNTTAFSRMLQRIGVKSIRIGGNSSERSGYPTINDAEKVIDFANLVGANLLWTVPVKTAQYDPTTYSNFVATMNSYQKSKGYGISTTYLIGNESDIAMDSGASPSIPYSTWRYRFNNYSTLFRNSDNSITASGPASAGTSYASQFANDADYTGSGSQKYAVGFVTGHKYALGGTSDSGPSNSQQAITKFLADNSGNYSGTYNGWPTTAYNRGMKTRIDETNVLYYQNGQDQALEHEYAAALWVLDYLSYMAYKTNLSGMNLHNGPIGSNSYNTFSPIGYQSNSSVNLEPIGYGMLAFTYTGQGTPMTASITSNSSSVNMSAYALVEGNGTASAHILNKTQGSGAIDASVNISISGYAHAQVMYLKQTNSDVTATDGITLGGASVASDGTWSGAGNWAVTGLSPTNGVFTISVPHTQVAVVHFYN